jgi:hypothetical protein
VSIDLRAHKTGGTWVRRFGSHEDQGVHISVRNDSAHVTLTSLDIMFAVDRADVPSAWDDVVDVVKVEAELKAAVLQRLSLEAITDLFRAISSQRQSAFSQGERSARFQMREALGLV